MKKWVYVIGPTGGPLKLGITDDCNQRRTMLNVGNPLLLRLWHRHEAESEVQARMIERNLHYQFRDSHIRGEWFRLVESDLPRVRQVIHMAHFVEYDLEDWSLERKSCDEFTPEVCARARRALDLSVKELASRAEMSEPTISNFESGTSAPHLETIELLRATLERLGVEFVPVESGRPFKILL